LRSGQGSPRDLRPGDLRPGVRQGEVLQGQVLQRALPEGEVLQGQGLQRALPEGTLLQALRSGHLRSGQVRPLRPGVRQGEVLQREVP